MGHQDVLIAGVGCFGACHQEPLVTVSVPGAPMVVLRHVRSQDALRILESVSTRAMPPDLIYCKIEEWDHITAQLRYGQGYPEIVAWNAIPFFKGQKKIVLRNCGLINPEDIEEYIGVGGYQTLYKVLIDSRPELVIDQIKASRLRGRGGAGFLTGNKWDFLAKAKSETKYIICNADEGDPGAYMNRNEIEGDPHALLEGMVIGAYASEGTHGIIYVRAEYPLAVRRLTRAIEQAREYGLLGQNILNRGFNFDIELVQGAGAFVCGEETALIASLEDSAGRPRARPPYPAQSGLWGKPTNINNVETWCNIAPIIARGACWFSETGSVKSPGTKVFSLVGKVQNTGLVEMPFGAPLRSFIYDIGEGAINGRKIKAVRTGGPSGGCIPAEMFDTPVDYESLAQIGSIMGSGGMVVMDEDNCMVGACELQSMARLLGVTHVRYSQSNPRLAVDMSHPRFVLDPNRCILCTRCVSACSQIEGADVWEVASRCIRSLIVSDLHNEWGAAKGCTGCGKCVQACPTGALTEKAFLSLATAKTCERLVRLSKRRKAAQACSS
jgi:NADH-quinone oxidoreductase subunit F